MDIQKKFIDNTILKYTNLLPELTNIIINFLDIRQHRCEFCTKINKNDVVIKYVPTVPVNNRLYHYKNSVSFLCINCLFYNVPQNICDGSNLFEVFRLYYLNYSGRYIQLFKYIKDYMNNKGGFLTLTNTDLEYVLYKFDSSELSFFFKTDIYQLLTVD